MKIHSAVFSFVQTERQAYLLQEAIRIVKNMPKKGLFAETL
jgi:hypothetical protein